MGRLLAVVAVMGICVIPTAEARAAAEIAVWPADTFVSTGDRFELQIFANSDVADLMGFNITVSYNPVVLSIESVSEGALLSDSGYETIFRWLNPGEETNEISANGAVLGHTVGGPGPLCTLKFRARAHGVSAIFIVASDLRNGVNTSIDHAVGSGMVYVDSTIRVESVTWGVIKHIYR